MPISILDLIIELHSLASAGSKIGVVRKLMTSWRNQKNQKILYFFRFRLRPCRFKENCPHSTNCWKKKSSSRKKRKRGSTFYYLGPVFDLHKSHKWSFSKTPLSWSRFRLDRNLLKTLRDFPDRFSSKRPVIVEFLTFFSVVKHMMNFQSENPRESNSSGVT